MKQYIPRENLKLVLKTLQAMDPGRFRSLRGFYAKRMEENPAEDDAVFVRAFIEGIPKGSPPC